VLKKAAVAVVITAAGLLAVSPLAFAGNDHSGHGNKAVEKSEGLVNVADNNINTPIQACNNDVPVNGGAVPVQVPVKDITVPPPARWASWARRGPRPTRRSTTPAPAATTPPRATR
jgi:hypothetical protein